MKNISNEFKTELTAFGRQYQNIINVYDNLMLSTQSGDMLLTENNNELIAKTSTTDVSMEINDENIYSIKLITKGEILSTLMKELDFESGLNLDIGSVIEYKFGLKVGNDYEYIDYGRYIIYKKEFNQDTKNYVYTCYDFMLKTMIMIGEEFHFSTQPTGADMIPEICSILGIDFDDSIEDENQKPTPYGMIKNLIYNINLSIINSSKITYRDLLNTLCQYFGVSMYMENNELKLKLLGNIIDDNGTWVVDNQNVTIVDNVTKKFMKDKNVTFKSLYGPINSLIITGTDETKQLYVENTPSVENNGLTTFKIEKNILINDTEVWNNYGVVITNNIFELLNNVNFELCDFSSNGIMYLDWLDYFNVTIDNNVYKCLLLNSEITVKSGISENIYTEIPEKNESEYTTSDKSNDIIGDTIRSRGNAYANGEKLVQESEVYKEYILYNSATGGINTGIITLNDYAYNYDYMEIYFRTNDGENAKSSIKIYNPNNAITSLTYTWFNNNMYVKYAKATIFNDSITLSDTKQYSFYNGSTIELRDAEFIYITRVVGYKK